VSLLVNDVRHIAVLTVRRLRRSFETLISRLFRDRVQFCSGLLLLARDIAGDANQGRASGGGVVAVDVEVDLVIAIGAKRMGGIINRIAADVPLKRQEQIKVRRHASQRGVHPEARPFAFGAR